MAGAGESEARFGRAASSPFVLPGRDPGLDAALGRDQVDQAHIVRPSSHATRNGLEVRLNLAE